MTRLTIIVTFAIVAALSFATTIASASKGRQPAACANTTLNVKRFNAAPGEELLPAAPGEEMLSTVTVSNCAKDTTTMTVEQMMIDTCGNEIGPLSTTVFRLRRGETRQTMVSFLAPGAECGGSVTVISKVTGQNGALLSSNTSYFNLIEPTP